MLAGGSDLVASNVDIQQMLPSCQLIFVNGWRAANSIPGENCDCSVVEDSSASMLLSMALARHY